MLGTTAARLLMKSAQMRKQSPSTTQVLTWAVLSQDTLLPPCSRTFSVCDMPGSMGVVVSPRLLTWDLKSGGETQNTQARDW